MHKAQKVLKERGIVERDQFLWSRNIWAGRDAAVKQAEVAKSQDPRLEGKRALWNRWEGKLDYYYSFPEFVAHFGKYCKGVEKNSAGNGSIAKGLRFWTMAEEFNGGQRQPTRTESALLYAREKWFAAQKEWEETPETWENAERKVQSAKSRSRCLRHRRSRRSAVVPTPSWSSPTTSAEIQTEASRAR